MIKDTFFRGITIQDREYKTLHGKCKTRKMTKKEKDKYSKYTGSGIKISELVNMKNMG